MCPPQATQYHFACPPAGCHERNRSAPCTISNASRARRALAADDVPVRRWQLWQWQYRADSNGALTVKRTSPHAQRPVNGCSGEGAMSETLPSAQPVDCAGSSFAVAEPGERTTPQTAATPRTAIAASTRRPACRPATNPTRAPAWGRDTLVKTVVAMPTPTAPLTSWNMKVRPVPTPVRDGSRSVPVRRRPSAPAAGSRSRSRSRDPAARSSQDTRLERQVYGSGSSGVSSPKGHCALASSGCVGGQNRLDSSCLTSGTERGATALRSAADQSDRELTGQAPGRRHPRTLTLSLTVQASPARRPQAGRKTFA